MPPPFVQSDNAGIPASCFATIANVCDVPISAECAAIGITISRNNLCNVPRMDGLPKGVNIVKSTSCHHVMSHVIASCLIAMVRRAQAQVLAITADNGTEFHGYLAVEATTGATIDFARSYHPWESGTNENTSGLIRQYLPKAQSMTWLSQARCNAIALKLNTRPRKRLDYDTPINRLQAA
jgi:hypothetical protein